MTIEVKKPISLDNLNQAFEDLNKASHSKKMAGFNAKKYKGKISGLLK